eukprot:scaffold15194_cov24-Attheya_sp.AAC.1
MTKVTEIVSFLYSFLAVILVPREVDWDCGSKCSYRRAHHGWILSWSVRAMSCHHLVGGAIRPVSRPAVAFVG